MPRDVSKESKPVMAGLHMLFADDEPSLQELMRVELPRMGHRVTVCPDGTTAARAIEENAFDCILVDLDMPGMNGIDVVAHARAVSPDTDAVIMTGKGSIDTAIEALRHGAFDYLRKPCRLMEIENVLRRVAERRALEKKYRAVKRQLERLEGKSELIGCSEAMEGVRRRIEKVAPTSATVLILGETGTGKELVARALHDKSARFDQPFVAVNCGALPENLIESELFGHRKGAYTGADEHRTGLFEVAGGGTVFLDEIGEMPLVVQAKLLRFLESGEIRRVGENEAFTCDVRVLCATHRHLEDMVEEETFRQDLWYRINTFEIDLPPLRERTEDIADLARVLAGRFRKLPPELEAVFDDETLNLLSDYEWPGNVRELANVVEHAMILCDDLPITADALPRRIGRHATGDKAELAIFDGARSLKDIEMEAIRRALERHDGAKPEAAKELGISLKTLYNKLNQDAAQRAA